ncbi:multicopper oxidase domain-containing protein [Pasteurellaceae bacterium HPA106]|uniref:multicopper oxidase domain-containing protein n=1 Tax=Spirabiliibacterium pneumoniae TaxID=221400 RepID=UPI001AAE103B|nr:multicopper oxidase domain-containing protein [Spirabiliibacterium pneumoniae]MBE2896960.1 multicopper oxidase domain-containing protein [Spirabiliibacterium pneumoniae]
MKNAPNLPLSRRALLKHTAVLGAGALLPNIALAQKGRALPIPPLLDVGRGKPVLLSMTRTQTRFLDGNKVDVWGFNGAYLGPTIKCKQGDFVRLNYRNQLEQAVSLTVQGLQASGELLGGVGKVFQPNSEWSPVIPITQNAASCWYHANTLAHSGYQVYRGLLGLWLIEDKDSRKAMLPNQYGVNDIPLILQDVQLNRQGEQLFNPNVYPFLGNHLLVNGVQAPYLNVARGWVRLRVLNASLSRSYQLSLDNGAQMVLLAGNLGFVPQQRTIQQLFLSPGERAEVLVDINEGSEVTLITGEKRGFLHNLTALWADDSELSDNRVLTLRPEGMVSAFAQKPYINAALQFDSPIEVVRERDFHLDVDNALLNGQRFDPRRIDVSAKLGSYERWKLSSSTPTGFRIEGAKFLVERVNGNKVDLTQASWRDTLWLNATMSVLVKFDNMSSNNYPFTFGASDFILADKGCLGMIVVQ